MKVSDSYLINEDQYLNSIDYLRYCRNLQSRRLIN